nr:toll/interleukin-1 receptor domain-containing protein [Photobacterium phosphoreum]
MKIKSKSEITQSEISLNKVFISHAYKDAEVVEEIIELLEAIGVESNQIFCTSFEGYGIGLGENFLDTIKNELSSNSMVLFILSENFYRSPICMCEMGAAWVLSKEHIPLIVPPLNYSDIKGVFPLTQGMVLTDAMKLNSFKDKIEKTFNITNKLSFSTWERKRDRVCSRLGGIIG